MLNIIDRSALSLAKSIRSNYTEAASEEVLTFSLTVLLNTVIAIFISVVIAFFTGNFISVIIFMTGFIVLRMISGGVHLTSSLACCIFSIFIFTLGTHLTLDYLYIGFTLNCLSIIILLFTAPSKIENVSRVDPKHYPILKGAALIIVITNFFIKSELLSLAYFIQSVLTLPISYTFVHILERRSLR